MTPEDRLTAIRERLSVLSPRPWTIEGGYSARVYAADGSEVCRLGGVKNSPPDRLLCANVAFFRNAAADIEWLLGEVERLGAGGQPVVAFEAGVITTLADQFVMQRWGPKGDQPALDPEWDAGLSIGGVKHALVAFATFAQQKPKVS